MTNKLTGVVLCEDYSIGSTEKITQVPEIGGLYAGSHVHIAFISLVAEYRWEIMTVPKYKGL